MPLAGCLSPSLLTSAANRSRSSARSIACGDVPRIGIPSASSARARLSGVCPPNCTITPTSSPVDCSTRSEEHTSELQSLMHISYAVFCLKKKNKNKHHTNTHNTTQQHTHHTTIHI